MSLDRYELIRLHKRFGTRIILFTLNATSLFVAAPAEAGPSTSSQDQPSPDGRRFVKERDWLTELDRQKVKGFRVLACNPQYTNYPR